MNTSFFRISTLFSLIFSFSVQANQLSQQRETYQKINQILSISTNEHSRALAKNLLTELEGYPLYPYAKYQLLNSEPQHQIEQIQLVSEKYATLPFVSTLKKNWRKQLQQTQDWQTLLTHSALLPQDNATQCLLLQAQTADKTPEKLTALLAEKHGELNALWLTGKSLPTECDGIFSLWQQQGGLSDDLLKQRGLLAFEEKNGGLLTHLHNHSQNTELKTWLTELNSLLTTPTLLNEANYLFSFEKLTDLAQDKRILIAAMPAYIKTLKAENFTAHFAHFDNLAQRLGLEKSTLTEWKTAYLNQFFDVENAAFQQWRDEQLIELKADKLTERRLRQALRQQEKLVPWLNLLSTESLRKDEWQYWLAKSDKNKTQEILTALSRQRSFWGVLAAKELNLPYQPEILPFSPAEKNLTEDPQIQATLARIAELRYFQDWNNLNREWKTLLENSDFEQKLQLADYANTQGWFELGVEATIQAKAWGYLSLRLPNAYQAWFDLHLNGKKIHRTFAMAIARQESAFRPNVSSSANARGLMQLLPSTAKLTAQKAKLPYKNEAQLFDPFDNIMLGTAHLQELYDKFGDNRILIAAAYNAGSHRVSQWLAKSQGKLTMAEFVSSIPFFETRGYVQNVLAYDVYYQILQQKPQQLFSKQEYDRLY